MSHWYERDAPRLASETTAWASQGFQRTIADGAVSFEGTVEHGRASYRTRVDYPFGFPYERPTVTLPDIAVTATDKHRTLLDGVLCLRGYLPDEWDSNHLGIDLLPDLHQWLTGHENGSWDNEHRAVDVQFLPRCMNRTALIDDPYEEQARDSHGRLEGYTYANGPNEILHLTTASPLIEGVRQTSIGAYLQLPSPPLEIAERVRRASSPYLDSRIVIEALAQEFPALNVRATLQGYLGAEKRWPHETLVALQFPLPGEEHPRWVWECLLLHKNYGFQPIQVNYVRDMFNRVRHELDRTILQDARVAVVGLGSVGAAVALELAKAGVGTFTLLDSDTINISNLSRHPASIAHLGMAKTVAVKQLLTQHVPRVKVIAGIGENVRTNVFGHYDDLRRIAETHDVIAVCIGNDNVHQYLNEIFLREVARAVYGWVYLDGCAGRIVRVVPGSTGCLACCTRWIEEHPDHYGRTPRIPRDINRLPVDYGCNTPAVPGSGFDTNRIANSQARMVLQLLLGGDAKYPNDLADHRLLLNRPISTIQESDFETSRSFTLPRHPSCDRCG